MRKVNKNAGWYHYSDGDGFVGIEYIPEGLGEAKNTGDYKYRQQAYGPFKTFGECKKDATDFWRSDVAIGLRYRRLWDSSRYSNARTIHG